MSIDEWEAKIDELGERVAGWAEEHDAQSIHPVAAAHALGMFYKLHQDITAAGLTWLDPHLSTEGNGDVEMVWSYGARSLHVDVTTNAVYWLKVWGATFAEMEEGELTCEPGQVAALWRWLLEAV